jgi:predicted Na+-dependent transporter
MCVAFFVYEIFWNTKVFMFYLPLVPGLLVDMWYDAPVGRFFLSVLMIIVGWWIVCPVLRRMIHRKLRSLGYD